MLLSSRGGADSVIQFITVLVIFVLVLFITLYVTKWIAGFQKQQMSGEYMRIIDSMSLAPGQCVQIVQIGDHYLAIAVSKEQVTLLCELAESEIGELPLESRDKDFSKVFAKFKDNFLQKGNDNTDHTQGQDEER